MHVLFAAAELAPLAKVGGLGEATRGLVRGLREVGVRLDVVVPDYTGEPPGHTGSRRRGARPAAPTDHLPVPPWAGPARVRTVEVDGIGEVHAVAVPGIARPHPYVHPDLGVGWADNDRRFFAFSHAVAALTERLRPDVVHLNDWHTATALARLDPATVASVFTVHNLAYQGIAHPGWLPALGRRGAAFGHEGRCNPMAGALVLADRIVTVSPTYLREICRPDGGEGLHRLLDTRRDRLVGIRNGIDNSRWNPATDAWLPVPFNGHRPGGRRVCRDALHRMVGLEPDDRPLVGVVARMAAQKGIDLAVELVPLLGTLPARMVITGDGDAGVVALARDAARRRPDLLR